jgi:hypothetical protein
VAPTLTIGGIHLINSTGAPVAGGTATAAATTPFALRGDWNPTTAEQQLIMSGGPPFSLGARPLYYGYDNVIERIPLNVTGSTHENAVTKLQELKLAVLTALYSTNALLTYQPTSSSSTAYAEVLAASVQELPNAGLDPVEGGVDIDFDLIVTRAPFPSAGSLTTLQSAITVTNAGTGANNNTRTLGSPTGDLIYEGSPLNVKLVPNASSGGRYYYLATVYQRVYNAGVSGTTTTSSTSGAAAFNDSTATITNPARTRNGLRLRLMLRCTSISAKAQVQAQLVANNSSQTLWKGPWVSGNLAGAATLIDATPFGVPLDLIRRSELENGDVNVGLLVRSTDGTSVSLNLHSAEYLLYYTFCRIDATTDLGTGAFMQIEAAHNLGGFYVPHVQPSAYIGFDDSGTDVLDDIADVRGTLPRAISGASLYFAWLGSTYLLDATDTAVVTTKHLPLYRTLRGAG